MKTKGYFYRIGKQRGATAVVVAVSLLVLIGFAALAIDLGYLYVVKNELQNAADAGALAGAKALYNEDGTEVNPGANQAALDLVTANYSEKSPVEIESIDRGHWSFATKTFTPNSSLLPVDLWDLSTEELDANTDFINAVRVITKRKTTGQNGGHEEPFLAKIFGISGPSLTATAVAYIGFAGTIETGEADQPIAICEESLLQNGKYSCSVGRMMNSGNSANSSITGETGGWTNFSQVNPCSGGTNANEVKGLVCKSGNPNPLVFDQNLATQGGQMESALKPLQSCWIQNTDLDGNGTPDQPWKLTLPVIQCNNENPGPCNKMTGVVEVNIIWIQAKNDPHYNDVPVKMGNYWDGSGITDGALRWKDFADHFKLKNKDGVTTASYLDNTIYFLPDCNVHKPTGGTGGKNFGILAENPVLVK